MPAPKVWIGPEPPPGLADAVAAAGGDVVATPAEADALVWRGPWEGLRDALHPGVRWVQLGSAGIEDWFDEGLVDRERVWTSAAGAYAVAVAEHVCALILAGTRRLPELARLDHWERLEGTRLHGRTVGIVGAGGIGRAVIERLAPFGVRVLAQTRSGRDVAGAERSYGPDGLPALLEESDIVVLTAPLTPATRHMLDAAALARLRPSALVVNVGRGALIDTDALVAALRAGRLGGACLDVTDPEPLPDGHPLWSLPTVLITPHVANTSAMLEEAFRQHVVDNVGRFGRGEPLHSVVDVDRGY
jgi:D-3-phosphoglycerate dehydrogenase